MARELGDQAVLNPGCQLASCIRSGEVKDLDPFGAQVRRGVGMDADQQIGIEPVGKGGARGKATSLVLLARHDDLMIQILELLPEQKRGIERELLLFEAPRYEPDGPRIRSS